MNHRATRLKRLFLHPIAFVAVCLILMAAGCSSTEDDVRESLNDWDATIIRYSWNCDALGQAMERWLEMNEEELRKDVLKLANQTTELDRSKRRQLLRDVTSGEKSAQAHKRLAQCGDDGTVAAQLAVMADILMPIIMIEPPPEPAPPPSDASE